MRTTTDLRSVTMLEHAVGYTAAALEHVTEERLRGETPCAGWSLRDLLEHMDDSLAAFTEAGEVGSVALARDLRDVPHLPDAVRLVRRLQVRACAVLQVWRERESRQGGLDEVVVGVGSIDPDLLVSIGALEIAVHGWDVATACGVDAPWPAHLARALLDVALDVVGPADRGRRFASAQATDSDDPAERLLAFLGR